MRNRLGLKFLSIVIASLGLVAITATVYDARADELAPSQLIKPSDMTPIELDFYNKATDPEVKKNFVITRSYVRIAQKVVDKKIPAEAFPAKPKGFSVQYLLPDDPTVINQAMGLSLAKLLEKCLDTHAPGCR
jgi:hypothetical protein